MIADSRWQNANLVLSEKQPSLPYAYLSCDPRWTQNRVSAKSSLYILPLLSCPILSVSNHDDSIVESNQVLARANAQTPQT